MTYAKDEYDSNVHETPYPMWVVACEHYGFVCTVWEKPGTGCSYIEQCPSCGSERVRTIRVENNEEHEAAITEANEAATATSI